MDKIKALALKSMKSHLKDFEQSNSMAHKTSWLVGAIELVKKYNGRDSVFYHTLSANDFYIQASSIEDKTVIRDKLDQKEKFIKLTFEQAIKHIEGTKSGKSTRSHDQPGTDLHQRRRGRAGPGASGSCAG